MSKNTLLGKKRETRETEGDDDLNNLYKTKEEHENKKKEGESEEEAGAKENGNKSQVSKEESKEKPKSIFGDFMASSKATTGGLFGFLGNEKTDKTLTGQAAGSSTLFGNIFQSGASSSGSLFGSKNLFNFSSMNTSGSSFLSSAKKTEEKALGEEESEGEGEAGEDLFQQSNSPNPYNPVEKSETQKEKGPYSKKYVKEIDNLFVYIRDEGKFVSKGKGFLSLEYAEMEGKKIGVVVFRNTMGNKIIEGFLSSNLKLTKYVKNFKHIASFSFLNKGKTGKFEIGYCKVPFAREEELKEFDKVFNEVTALLTPGSEEAKKDTEKDSTTGKETTTGKEESEKDK